MSIFEKIEIGVGYEALYLLMLVRFILNVAYNSRNAYILN